jgi:hypothetical protein
MKNLILENNKIYLGGRNRRVAYKLSSIGNLIIRINVSASYLRQNLTSLMNDGCVYINNELCVFKSVVLFGDDLYIEYEYVS